MSERPDWDDDMRALFEAMIAAEKAFCKYLNDHDWDAAFFELDLTGYKLGCEFERLRKVTLSNVYETERGE